ncbi:ribosome maturation factor RimM [Alginatibacterium sediminis]|uniref:Ribosome maturation factor RimM n=1 Tax=Alginatibacterium sediminis TaxID=2164068 RepID=A0A420EJS1_9ALTE|nr:ribosome maturation factor RimM [Alginatibacterium sediminis]RKF20908.1 ribosome maturation factor RimM [Alginatibacterium sediminis]
MSEETVIIGRLGAVYGIKGWLKVNSFTEEPEDIFSYQPWLVGPADKQRELKLTEWRRHSKSYIVKIEGYDLRELSQTLTGQDISVKSDDLPDLESDEYYWRDLIGMQVVNREGYRMGEVTDLMETGSNDVIVVKANLKDGFGKKERLIPFLESQTIDTVDKDSRVITVDWDPSF